MLEKIQIICFAIVFTGLIGCAGPKYEISASASSRAFEGTIETDGSVAITIGVIRFSAQIQIDKKDEFLLSSPNGEWFKCVVDTRESTYQSGRCKTNDISPYEGWQFSISNSTLTILDNRDSGKYYKGEIDVYTKQAYIQVRQRKYVGKLTGSFNDLDGKLVAEDGSFLVCRFYTAGTGAGHGYCSDRLGASYFIHWKKGFHI